MTELRRNIPVAEIAQYLPHRPPMVWIDEVLSFSDKAGECRVTLQADGHYMGADGLRATSCLEFIAQAYGFISVCHHLFVLNPHSKPLSKAFLASIKEAQLPSPEVLKKISPGDELRIAIDGIRALGPITMFTGHVRRGASLICEAQLKAFREYQA